MDNSYSWEWTSGEVNVVVEGKGGNWNTKEYRVNGDVVGVLRRVPKTIQFRSSMVSDFNQRLSPGWGFGGYVEANQAIIDQLISGKKPFGQVGIPSKDYDTIEDAREKDECRFGRGKKAFDVVNRIEQRFKAAGLLTKLNVECRVANYSTEEERLIGEIDVGPGDSVVYFNWYDMLACQNICVKDIGDLKALEADYRGAGLGMRMESIALYAERPLSSFFGGFEGGPVPMWVTGLILGYPIENTISMYLERSDIDGPVH